MSQLTSVELSRLTKQHAAGISSANIVRAFRGKGERFSEATLRKYVQLGLLPKSRRVGSRGRHRGSSGVYPIEVLGLINDIKKSLDKGATLEELRVGSVGLHGEVQILRRAKDEVMVRFEEALVRCEKGQIKGFRRMMQTAKRALEDNAKQLDALALKMSKAQVRMDGVG